MISAISSQGSVRFMVYQDAMNQQRLIRFMERLMRTSEQKVFLILDNLKVHHGKLAAAWLEKNKEKMEVFFLPPYEPEGIFANPASSLARWRRWPAMIS